MASNSNNNDPSQPGCSNSSSDASSHILRIQPTSTSPNSGQVITFRIKTLSGDMYTLSMNATDTIEQAKKRLSEENPNLKIVPERMRFIFQGKPLQDKSTISQDCKIAQDNVIHLVEKSPASTSSVADSNSASSSNSPAQNNHNPLVGHLHVNSNIAAIGSSAPGSNAHPGNLLPGQIQSGQIIIPIGVSIGPGGASPIPLMSRQSPQVNTAPNSSNNPACTPNPNVVLPQQIHVIGMLQQNKAQLNYHMAAIEHTISQMESHLSKLMTDPANTPAAMPPFEQYRAQPPAPNTSLSSNSTLLTGLDYSAEYRRCSRLMARFVQFSDSLVSDSDPTPTNSEAVFPLFSPPGVVPPSSSRGLSSSESSVSSSFRGLGPDHPFRHQFEHWTPHIMNSIAATLHSLSSSLNKVHHITHHSIPQEASSTVIQQHADTTAASSNSQSNLRTPLATITSTLPQTQQFDASRTPIQRGPAEQDPITALLSNVANIIGSLQPVAVGPNGMTWIAPAGMPATHQQNNTNNTNDTNNTNINNISNNTQNQRNTDPANGNINFSIPPQSPLIPPLQGISHDIASLGLLSDNAGSTSPTNQSVSIPANSAGTPTNATITSRSALTDDQFMAQWDEIIARDVEIQNSASVPGNDSDEEHAEIPQPPFSDAYLAYGNDRETTPLLHTVTAPSTSSSVSVVHASTSPTPLCDAVLGHALRGSHMAVFDENSNSTSETNSPLSSSNVPTELRAMFRQQFASLLRQRLDVESDYQIIRNGDTARYTNLRELSDRL